MGDGKDDVPRMNFVFYDTETTGTSVPFDQVIQFAGVLTNECFEVIDRFDAKCRRLPWVVPSPGALLVTGLAPRHIDDPNLPQFPEFIASIRDKLLSWSPAVFTGYNSFRFDEPLLQRALWQSLFPPYLTVTRGNSRFDILLLARAMEALKPEALPWPRDDDGKITFRLDRLAPALGFSHDNAHDATADVDATVFVARRLVEAFPDLCKVLLGRTMKANFAAAFPLHGIAMFAERNGGTARMWWGQRIDRQNDGRHAVFADLSVDWAQLATEISADNKLTELSRFVRKVALNRPVPVFTAAEAAKILTLTPPLEAQTTAIFLESWPRAPDLAANASYEDDDVSKEPRELEQMIYDGFASRIDETRMREFHAAVPIERVMIAESFQDKRFRSLAARILYLCVPEVLTAAAAERMSQGIRNRLFPEMEPNDYPWRSVAKARTELQELKNGSEDADARLDEIEAWLCMLASAS